MLYDTTTYYKLQAIQENTTPRPWASPAASACRSKFGPGRPVEAFSGVSGPYPLASPVSRLLDAPGRPGRGTPGPASLEMTMRDPRLPAAIVGCGDAGQLGSPWLLALFLGVQPVAFQLAPAVEVGTASATAFPAKPVFWVFELLRRSMRGAGGGAGTGAAVAAPLVSSLAVGQPFSGRGSRLVRGNPAGVPRP